MARYLISTLTAHRAQANEAARAIGGRGRTFGRATLVPSARPMKCGPALRDLACWNLTVEQVSTLTDELRTRGVEFAISEDRGASLTERLAVLGLNVECAPQQVDRVTLARKSAEQVGEIVGAQTERVALDFIKSATEQHSEKVAIGASVDARIAEIEGPR